MQSKTMKSKTRTEHVFDDGCDVDVTRGVMGDCVIRFGENKDDVSRAVIVRIPTEKAAILGRSLSRTEEHGDPDEDCEYLTFEEDAQTRMSKDGGTYHFHVSGEIQGKRRVLNCSIPASVLMKATRWIFGELVLMGFENLMGRYTARLPEGDEE